jgi:hypothetical protein
MRERLLTVAELAELMRQHPVTIYKRSRSIPGCIKLGAVIRFRESAIKRWLRESEQQEQPE